MKEDAYKILKFAIEEHREQLLGSRQACLGILRDFGGREHPEINLLADAVEEGIPNNLLSSQVISNETIDRLIDKFSSSRFLDPGAAKFAVASWADALGLLEIQTDLFNAESRAVETVSSLKEIPEREWFYHENDATLGPVSESSIHGMILSKKLSPETQIWSTGMQEWISAHRIFPAENFGFDEPNNDSNTILDARMQPSASIDSIGQIRPWIRLFARTIDILIFGFLLSLVLAIFVPEFLSLGDTLISFLILLVFVFVEPIMLSYWGTTIGKKIFSIKLTKIDKSKISYEEALYRCLNVWVKGLGLGIPLVGLFTQIAAYNRLKNKGVTSWDENKFLFCHEKIQTWKIACCASFLILFMLLLSM
jgi:hypothetical protein